MAETLQLPIPALPDYKGRAPTAMRTAITGTGNRTTAAHDIGDTVVIVVEAVVTEAGHLETKDGLVYRERLSTKDLFELPRDRGRLLVNGLRQAAGDGTGTLPGVVDAEVDAGERVLADASGVVVTPAEAAELHGIPLDPALEPVVLVFDDLTTGRWPDDWAGLGVDRRVRPGQFMRRPGATDPGDVGQVVRVLEDDTGELIEEWTEADEDARLLALEKAALEAEQADRPPAQDGPVHVAEVLPDAEAAIAAGNMPPHPDEPDFVSWADAEDRRRVEQIIAHVLDLDDVRTIEDLVGSGRALLDAEPAALGEAIASRLTPYISELAGLLERLEAGGPGPFDPTPPSSGPDEELELPAEDGEALAEVRPLRAAGPIDAPGRDDYAFVDRKLDDMRAAIDALEDRDRVLRLVRAEEEGRGRGLKPRRGVLDALERRARELFIAAPTPEPALAGGFDVPVDAVPVEE